ncbi:response regulator [Chloroherpeton thalassium]|nr:response regulator [Chloroherpeton thalassium]
MPNSKTILIIDDDPISQQLYVAALTGVNLSFHSCSTADAGYHELCHENYDAVLLDLILPGANGTELLQALNKEKIKYPPVILISGNGQERLIKECLSLGAAEYLRKPIRTSFLRLLVKEVLNIQDASDKTLPEIMKLLERDKRSAKVWVKTELGQGVLSYEAGHLSAVKYLDLTKSDAMTKLSQTEPFKIELEYKS